MSAADRNKGGVSGLEALVASKAAEVIKLILSGKRGNDPETLRVLDRALQSVIDGMPFGVQERRPKSLDEFLALQDPISGIFRQLASEVEWPDLVSDIERRCFLRSETAAKLSPSASNLFFSETGVRPRKSPFGWHYLPVPRAVEAYQKLLGSDLKGDWVIDRFNDLRLDGRLVSPDSEGIAVWPKLSVLATLFGVGGDPLEESGEGNRAYGKLVELFLEELGKAYTKAYPQHKFHNFLDLTSFLNLTPAGRETWKRLEAMSEDSFVVSPAGASFGFFYAGTSVRRSRVSIVFSGRRFPQDCIMVMATLAIQPERLTKDTDLGIDCPGTEGGVDEYDSTSPLFCWLEGGLWASNNEDRPDKVRFGSATGFFHS